MPTFARRFLTSLSILTLSAAAFCASTTPISAFEPTTPDETAIYNARLIPAPVAVEFGRRVVVLNDRLEVALVLPDEAVADEAALGAVVQSTKAFLAEKFAAKVDPKAFSATQAAQLFGERAAQNADFAQIAEAVAPNADFFKAPNALKVFAVADSAVAADASPAEIAEKRETSAGTLVIAASDAAGIRDSLKTIFQLAEPFGDTLKTSRFLVPETKIEDRPALGFRGIHLCWFPETNAARIEQAIRIAALYKFNYAVIEFWGTFPFENHPELYWDEFHTTKDEVVKLVKLGKELGIELIPQLNIFGHATAARVSVGKHVVLDRYPEYAPLFEPDGWTWRVSNPEARALLTECVLELYETFDKPRYFHLGCDEAYSAATGFEARRGGPYVDALASWLVWFRDVLAERNCRVMMWHDMLIEPKPEFKGYVVSGGPKTRGLLERLPKDVVVCDWEYYIKPPKDGKWPTTAFFQGQGFDVLVCPWRDTTGIRSLATYAAETNGMGVLCTTWHHFYGGDMRNILIYGAQAAWGTRYRGGNLNVEFNRHLKQASEPIKNKKYVVHGVNDWQVIPETNGPQG